MHEASSDKSFSNSGLGEVSYAGTSDRRRAGQTVTNGPCSGPDGWPRGVHSTHPWELGMFMVLDLREGLESGRMGRNCMGQGQAAADMQPKLPGLLVFGEPGPGLPTPV